MMYVLFVLLFYFIDFLTNELSDILLDIICIFRIQICINAFPYRVICSISYIKRKSLILLHFIYIIDSV